MIIIKMHDTVVDHFEVVRFLEKKTEWEEMIKSHFLDSRGIKKPGMSIVKCYVGISK